MNNTIIKAVLTDNPFDSLKQTFILHFDSRVSDFSERINNMNYYGPWIKQSYKHYKKQRRKHKKYEVVT